VDLVLAELKRGRGPFRVVGPLVHNPLVLEALSERGVGICADPAGAEARAEWFTLESMRTSPEILAWECARLGEDALCYAALAEADAPVEDPGRMLADPGAYAGRMAAPAL